ncbi:MAG TPA: MFS transporter [Thermoanaerobaculia bacterium]|nr:MFS transporter [Thermoanaerobaculia bacterium]
MSSDPAAIFGDVPPAARQEVPAYSWYALLLLTLVYVLNFLDRMVIYILFTPIQAEMRFSDFQLAVLGTTSFVIFYTLLGVPFGRLADRVVRKNLIAGGLAVWSLFSGLTGFADGFWTIFLCRLMVGVGEATLGPAALSLLSDYFPPRLRATVQGIYSSGIAIGGGLAFFLGGWIGQTYGWRWAFYLLGFPGLALAVFVFLLREPARGRMEAAAVRYGREDWKILFRSVPLRYLYVGYALFGLAANNIGVWGASFFIRVHEMSLAFVGTAAGILSVAVGMPVMILGGYVSDRFRQRGKGGRMAFTAWAALLSVPLWLGLLFVDDGGALLLVSVVLYGLALIWVAPATADLHEIAGPHLRGLGIGILFSMIYIVAYLVGSPLIGRLNDALGVTADAEKMRLSLLVCPAACALAALLLWMGSRTREATGEG